MPQSMSWLSAWLGSNSSSDSSPKASSDCARFDLGLLVLFILSVCGLCDLCVVAGNCMVVGIVIVWRGTCIWDRSDPLVSVSCLRLFLPIPLAIVECWCGLYALLPSLDHFSVADGVLVWCSGVSCCCF